MKFTGAWRDTEEREGGGGGARAAFALGVVDSLLASFSTRTPLRGKRRRRDEGTGVVVDVDERKRV